MAPKPIGIVASTLRKRFHRENPGLNLGDLVKTQDGKPVEYRGISASANPPTITVYAYEPKNPGKPVEIRGITFEGRAVRILYVIRDRPTVPHGQDPRADLTSIARQPVRHYTSPPPSYSGYGSPSGHRY